MNKGCTSLQRKPRRAKDAPQKMNIKLSPDAMSGLLPVSAVYKPSSVLDDHLSRPEVAFSAPAITRGRDGPPHMPSYQSCTRWGLQSGQVAMPLVSSYLAFPPLPRVTRGGIFLLHFPWSRLHWVLPSTLPCGARTFLRRHNGARDHLIYSPLLHNKK